MNDTQDQSGPKNTFPTANLPKGGVRLSDLEKKRAENLRNNLSRRKQQARERQNQDDSSDER